MRIRSVVLLLLVLSPLFAACAQGNEETVEQFFREYVGLNQDQIAKIRTGKAFVMVGGAVGGIVGIYLSIPLVAALRVVWRRLPAQKAAEPPPSRVPNSLLSV